MDRPAIVKRFTTRRIVWVAAALVLIAFGWVTWATWRMTDKDHVQKLVVKRLVSYNAGLDELKDRKSEIAEMSKSNDDWVSVNRVLNGLEPDQSKFVGRAEQIRDHGSNGDDDGLEDSTVLAKLSDYVIALKWGKENLPTKKAVPEALKRLR